MALPIAPTPILRGKDVDKFNKIIEEGLKNKKPLPPLPDLSKARRKIREYVEQQKQNNK